MEILWNYTIVFNTEHRWLLSWQAGLPRRVSVQTPQHLHDHAKWSLCHQYQVPSAVTGESIYFFYFKVAIILEWQMTLNYNILYAYFIVWVVDSRINFFRLCLSISDFHPDTWNPAWSVSTILTGLLSFMVSEVQKGSDYEDLYCDIKLVDKYNKTNY